MEEVVTIKSAGRRVAEIAFYLWGLFGMAYLLITSHIASGYSATASSTQVMRVLTLQALIWIGGIVFIGFFAHFSPVRQVQKQKGPA